MSGALGDLVGGLTRPWLWGGLAWSDLRQRYRGSLLGPFWITASIAILVAGLALVLADPLGAAIGRYAPYVAIGLVLWQFIQTVVNESCLMFVMGAETVRQSPIPLSVHAYRLVARNVMILVHTAVVIPVVLAVYGLPVFPGVLLALPGLCLMVLTAFSVSLTLGVLGARYRDIPPVVTNGLQLAFFMTPVFWPVSTLGTDRLWIATWNPVFAFIDIVRAPLLHEAPLGSSWPMALAATVLMLAAGLAAFSFSRRRLAFWV